MVSDVEIPPAAIETHLPESRLPSKGGVGSTFDDGFLLPMILLPVSPPNTSATSVILQSHP